MDLKNMCVCLNNTGQIKSNLDGVAIVLVKYTSIPSDNIDINIDNEEKTISATIKEIQFDSAENFPEIGSDRLIYVDKSQNTPYRWDSETKSYKSLGKDLSAEFKALEKKIDNISKETIKDIVVNNETSVNEEKIANINIQLQHDQSNSLLYYLMVNNKKAGEINIPKDQFLKSVSYNPDTHIITFVWVTTTGEQTTTINISDLIDVYVAGNGLELQDNVFSIKVDPNSSGMLTVSEEGIKLELEPATEKTLGLVRAWIDEYGYLCVSTEEWVAFENTQIDNSLYIQGSMDIQQQDGSLIIN